MSNLLRAELVKIRKSKSLKVMIGIIFGFAMFSALIYSTIDNKTDGALSFVVDGRSIFTSSFSFSNNVGIVIPIVLIMYLCVEFSNGTVRNKIIAGNSKSKIYLVNFIVVTALGALYVILNAILSFLIAVIFFDYGKAINGAEVVHILKVTLLGCLMYISLFSFVTLLAMIIKKTGVSVVLYLLFVIVVSVFQIVHQLEMGGVLEFIFKVSPLGQMIVIMKDSISGMDIVKSLINNVVITGMIGTLGTVLFQKIDLK